MYIIYVYSATRNVSICLKCQIGFCRGLFLSACNAGDLGLIPGSGRSTGEGKGCLVAQMVKRLSAMQETRVRCLGWEDPLEKEMAVHSSILAWKIPWTAEPGRLPSMGSQRVGHDWAISLSLSPTPVFWPGEFHGIYSPWVAKSWTWLSDFHFKESCTKQHN